MTLEHDFYPEGCSRDASDCPSCIGGTAASLVNITHDVTPEWAEKAFRRIYKHAACQLMQHTFIWSCTQREVEQPAA